MKILLYGFTAYDTFSDNITEKIIRALPPMKHVVARVLPVEFDREMFGSLFEEVKPDLIIGMGQHPRARKIRIERKARNLWAERKTKTPRPIEPRKPALAMSLKLSCEPGTCVTYDAGTYVCNFSMYWSERYSAGHGAKAAFLHVPRMLPVKDGVRIVRRLLRDLLD